MRRNEGEGLLNEPKMTVKYKRDNADIVQFKKVSLHYKNRDACLLVIKNLTQSVRYQQIKLEN